MNFPFSNVLNCFTWNDTAIQGTYICNIFFHYILSAYILDVKNIDTGWTLIMNLRSIREREGKFEKKLKIVFFFFLPINKQIYWDDWELSWCEVKRNEKILEKWLENKLCKNYTPSRYIIYWTINLWKYFRNFDKILVNFSF